MIPYSKQWWGIHLLFRIYGSALPRTLPFVLLSGSLAVFFFYIPSKSYWTSLFLHPYPYQLLAFIIGFILVFRNNLAYSRYWEGRTQLAALMGNLTDVAISCISFQHTSCCCQLGQTQAQAQAKASMHTDPNNNSNYCQFCDDIIHLVSLMNGLAIQQLRLDNDISNLYSHNDHCCTSPPPFDAGTLPKTTFERGHFEWLTLRSSPARIRRYNSAMKVPVIEKGWLLKTIKKEHRLRTRTRAGERRGGGGEGGGVLNGGKHERVSALFTVDIRGEEEGSNNNDDDEKSSSSSSHKLHVSVRKSLGEWHHHHHLNSNGNRDDIHNLASLSSSMPYAADTRVYKCYALLHNMVSQKMLTPSIPPSSSSATNPSSPPSHHHHQYWVNAPPTTAGVFRSLSYALVSYEQCRKLATTPFPFPYSQFVVLLMIFFSITAPIMFIGYVQDLWMTILLSACASATYSGLNEVARDIEDCFIYDPNELPLVRLQWEFNQRLIAAAAAF